MTLARIGILLSLGLDTLAVSIGLGLTGIPRQRWPRVGLTFALFEGLMPLVGLALGRPLNARLGGDAEIAAAALLVLVGLLSIREALSDEETATPAHGRPLLLTALSVSLDELAIGFTLGVLGIRLGPALAYIGAQALILTFVGLALGHRLGERLEERAELAAGLVLAALGVVLLVSALTGNHPI